MPNARHRLSRRALAYLGGSPYAGGEAGGTATGGATALPATAEAGGTVTSGATALPGVALPQLPTGRRRAVLGASLGAALGGATLAGSASPAYADRWWLEPEARQPVYGLPAGPTYVWPGALPSTEPPVAPPGGIGMIVSLSRQWLWAFEAGSVLLDTPVTTGRPELPTPRRAFQVLSKHAPYRFVSPWPPGSPFWYAPSVSNRAVRISDDGYFVHDAPWRGLYGPGTNVPHWDPVGGWMTGSHGCINVPEEPMRVLFGWAQPGMSVLVVE